MIIFVARVKSTETSGFWLWRPKFEGVLYLLAEVCDYDLIHEEFEVLLYELSGSNDERNQWMNYEFKGLKGNIQLKLAYDDEYPYELIHLQLEFPQEFKSLIDFIATLVSMFKVLDLEDHLKH